MIYTIHAFADFFGALRARVYDDEVRKWNKSRNPGFVPDLENEDEENEVR